MSRGERHVTIFMVRPTFARLPDVPVPPPFALRRWLPGDEAAWARIHEESDRHNEITPDLYRAQFGGDEEELAARQLFLCDAQGGAIGTATAWHNAHCPTGNYGRVHWIAIVPSYQGRGLGKALLSACVGRIRELGYDGAYLTTDPPRIPAINLYLRLGFAPDVRSEPELEAWRVLLDKVKGEFRGTVNEAIERFG
ncbi:MAG: GNAT family N-acetyltransferase [Candidatus Brocadiae bacterium]|nr:GNAT family N-acetyltransferase [Candidatus Brocadiia bacterium]